MPFVTGIMAVRAALKARVPICASLFLKDLVRVPNVGVIESTCSKNSSSTESRFCGNPNMQQQHYHDGRPRGSLWRGKKLIGKEALFVIQGLKRFKNDEDQLEKFIKSHVMRLLKMDLIAVLTELERQEEVALAVKIFKVIRKQDWYKPDVFLYKDLVVALARSKQMDDAMELWESMRKEDLYPDSQTYTEVIRGFLKFGSPADAMNVYEHMKNSPDPPEELPFRILLKGLLPHPILRNRVKQDFEDIFPDSHVYDPPEEIFGAR
uniref:Pentatricopeptide repeat-containing protein n=2 Tax=Kalanchoe fedtschenkoi TaxID=63787 RepID=A0A7N0ZZG2_KALFE